MNLRRVCLFAAALALTTPAGAKPLAASLNVCADQLLLALADESQIAALGPLSRDKNLSRGWQRAENFPQAAGAEDIVRLKPDVLIMGRNDKPAARDLINRFGPPPLLIDLWQGFEQGKAQIRRVAAALEQPRRGETLVARIEAAELAARDAGRGRTALILGRGGYADGPDSLTASLMRAAGLMPVETGKPAGGFLSMEVLAGLKPDVVITSSSGYGSADQRAEFLRHPALQAMLAKARVITLPSTLIVCEASLPEALEALAAELRR